VKQADAIVADFDGDQAGVAFNADRGRGGAGVTMNVGERFLNDAENGEFEFFFEAAEVFVDVDGDRDAAAFGEQFGVSGDGSDQARFFKKRRMKERRNEANFANRCASEAGAGADQLVDFAIGGGYAAADFGESHFQAGQGLRRGFVQFAADAALLFAADGE
jgi:hypothetical protein